MTDSGRLPPYNEYMEIRGIDATFLLVKDMNRARRFYDALLEKNPDTASEHWAEYELSDGSTLALGYHPGMEWRPGAGVMLGVADLQKACDRAASAGGTLTGAEFGGERCKSRECLDSEGNALYFHERFARG